MVRESNDAAFVAHWSRVGPLLARANRDELRRMTDEQHSQAVANVLALARVTVDSRPWSGLVEQQRLFTKATR